MRILSVDDDEEFCEYLESIFGLTDMEFSMVHEIKKAKEWILREKFDAIILDRDLPDGCGVDLARWIREFVDCNTILALITSHQFSLDEYHSLKKDVGINFISGKPLSLESAIQLADAITGMIVKGQKSTL